MSNAKVRVAGCFSELLQCRIGPDGSIVLITLQCRVPAVEAWHGNGPGWSIHCSGERSIAPKRARRFLAASGLHLSGSVRLRSAMSARGGVGASTATFVALIRFAGMDVLPDDPTRACIVTERASDPLMFPDAGRSAGLTAKGAFCGTFRPCRASMCSKVSLAGLNGLMRVTANSRTSRTSPKPGGRQHRPLIVTKSRYWLLFQRFGQ